MAMQFALGLLLSSGFAFGQPQVLLPELGLLQGLQVGTVAQFLGVPYAQAPIGALRWRSPQPLSPWTGVKTATGLPPPCVELPKPRQEANLNASEDCLFINVYAPAGALQGLQKLPVMFWIHGGGYSNGSPNLYPGEGLVSASGDQVVVVAVAYRLHLFGFLYSDELLKHNEGHGGNLGHQDQRFAMRWVQKYIAHFGGDPARVMVFGQSAGGNSVVNHLVQPASFGLYSRVGIQSGGNNQIIGVAYATAVYQELLAATSCGSLQCLLATNASALQQAGLVVAAQAPDAGQSRRLGGNGQGSKFWPVIDGITLLGAPTELIAKGLFNKVPVLLGSSRDEQALWLTRTLLPFNLTEEELDQEQRLSAVLPDLTEAQWSRVKELYKPDFYQYPSSLAGRSQSWWTLMRMMTDANCGTCVHRQLARNFHRGGAPAVFQYFFEIEPLTKHSSDTNFVFPTKSTLSPAQQALAAEMVRRWVRFADVGDPNSGGTSWPQFLPAADELFVFSETRGLLVQANVRKSACDFWDQFPYAYGLYRIQANYTSASATASAQNFALPLGCLGALAIGGLAVVGLRGRLSRPETRDMALSDTEEETSDGR